MRISIMRAWPTRHERCEVELPDGASVQDALAASGWEIADEAACGIWGKVYARERQLRDGDRVEIYRPLTADPKAARRKRALR